MSFKLVRNVDALDGEQQFNTEPGRIDGIMIVAEGTNNAGQVGTARDVGKVIVSRNDEQTHNRDFEQFADIGDIRSGTNIFSSTDGSTFQASAFIPFFEVGHPNALNIVNDQELNIRFQPSDDGTVFANLNVKFYVRVRAIGERYQYYMLGNDLSPSASVSGKVENLNRKNITALYLDDDTDDVLTSVQFEQNDRIVLSNVDFLALQADTIYNNRIEDSTFTIAQIQAHTPGVPGSTLNRNSILTYSTSATGTILLTVCAMKWGQGNGQGRN